MCAVPLNTWVFVVNKLLIILVYTEVCEMNKIILNFIRTVTVRLGISNKNNIRHFPRVFFQAVTYQGYLPKWPLPNCVISQMATSQVSSNLSALSLAHPSNRAALGLHCRLTLNCTLGKLPLGKSREKFFWEIT